MNTESLRALEAFCREPEPRIRRDTSYIHFDLSAVNQSQPNIIGLSNLPRAFMATLRNTFPGELLSLPKKDAHYISCGDNIHLYQFSHQNKYISISKIKNEDILSLQHLYKVLSKIKGGQTVRFPKDLRDFWDQVYVSFTQDDIHKIHRIVLSTAAALDLVLAPDSEVKMRSALRGMLKDSLNSNKVRSSRERSLEVSPLREWLPIAYKVPENRNSQPKI